MSHRKTVLFLGEAVTLAHVARPYVLAKSLDPDEYDVHFACHERYNPLFGSFPFKTHSLDSIPSEQFLKALAKGGRVYDRETLERYVKEDLKLIDQVKPDVIVGDFRLSLSVSARISQIPYYTITNAYWSPYAIQKWPVPDIPLSQLLGRTIAQPIFSAVRPVAFAYHALPLNQVREHYGLASLGPNLQRVYTDADYVLYADIQKLAPEMKPLPENHQFIGPILWEPDIPEPEWWGEIPEDKPVIYVSMGSSGNNDILPIIAKAISSLDGVGIFATVDNQDIATGRHGNIYATEYLPGTKAVDKADLVICNGGSPTTQQAICANTPVLCLPGNLDQHLNTQSLINKRVGEALLRPSVSQVQIRNSIIRTLKKRDNIDRYIQGTTLESTPLGTLLNRG